MVNVQRLPWLLIIFVAFLVIHLGVKVVDISSHKKAIEGVVVKVDSSNVLYHSTLLVRDSAIEVINDSVTFISFFKPKLGEVKLTIRRENKYISKDLVYYSKNIGYIVFVIAIIISVIIDWNTKSVGK